MSRSDPVIRHLGSALLPALERGTAIDGIFLDHILQGVALHVVGTYGDGRGTERAAGGLAPWQERRAKEMMLANMAGDVSLNQLAQICGLSVAHFARAFRQSAGTSPHRWLQQRRLEQAKALMVRTDETLPAIAAACGFADQSHFTRAFTRHAGVSPGQWRRQNRAGALPS